MSEKKKGNPPISILVYGKAGSGKSIFASTFPNALVLDADNGHKQYQEHFKHTYVGADKALDALSKAVQQLEAGTFKFDTIIIDSLTNIENLAISRKKGIDPKNWGNNLYAGKANKLTYSDWGDVSGSTISMLTYLRQLPINLVIITQVETKDDEGREVYKPNLVGKGSDEALHFADMVGFMEVQNDVEGTSRYLHLSSSEGDRFLAKARTLQGHIEPIKNPNYEKLVQVAQQTNMKLDFAN